MVQVAPNGCEECFPEWSVGGRSVCETTSGFESEKNPLRLYKLRKALYGLKHAPRAWYGRLRGFLFDQGFEIS
jgi:hypothetical protein